MRALRNIINEAVRSALLTERFQSSKLRSFFQEHGGLDPRWGADYLGDATDADVDHIQIFDNENDARHTMWGEQHSDRNRLIHMYATNDGTFAVVYFNKGVETGITWGGLQSKKKAERYWRNGERFSSYDHKTGEKRPGYIDDKDTYYYRHSGQDPWSDGAARFGIYNSKEYARYRNFRREQDRKAAERGVEDEHGEYRRHSLDNLRRYKSDRREQRDWERKNNRQYKPPVGRTPSDDKRFK